VDIANILSAFPQLALAANGSGAPAQIGGVMPSSILPSAAQTGQAGFYDPSKMAQLGTDQANLQRNMALAKQFMQQGSQYIPNSGGVGIAAGLASLLRGHMLQSDANASMKDVLQRTFESENQAAAAKRAQDIQDEQRKVQENIQEAIGKSKAEKDYQKSVVGEGFIVDPNNPNASMAIPGFAQQQIGIKTAEANAAAAANAKYREGRPDPFAEINRALAEGVITKAQADAAKAAKATGTQGGLAPKDQAAVDKRLPVLQDQTNKIDTAMEIAQQMKAKLDAGTYPSSLMERAAGTMAPDVLKTTGAQEMNTDTNDLVLAAQSALQGSGNRGSVAQLKILQQSKPSIANSPEANKNAIDTIIKTLQTARSLPAAELEHYGQGGTPTTWSQHAASLSGNPQMGAQPPGVSQGPPAKAAASAPTQTAVNPKTGQRIGLVDGNWVPI
jgi:hypothetical protein